MSDETRPFFHERLTPQCGAALVTLASASRLIVASAALRALGWHTRLARRADRVPAGRDPANLAAGPDGRSARCGVIGAGRSVIPARVQSRAAAVWRVSDLRSGLVTAPGDHHSIGLVHAHYFPP